MDLTKHLIDYKGKPYLPVVWRVIEFRAGFPLYGIETSIQVTQNSVIATAKIVNDSGKVLSTGHKTKPLTDNDAIAKAETGAVGRALSFFGIGTELAIQDLEEGDEIVDKAVANQPTKLEQFNAALKAPPTNVPHGTKAPPPPLPNQADGLKKASAAQIKRLWAVAKEKNLSNNDVFQMLNVKYRLSKVEDLNWKQYKEFVDGDMMNIETITEDINSQPPPPPFSDDLPF